MIKLLFATLSLIVIFDSKLFKAVLNGLFFAFVYTLASPIILYIIIVAVFGRD